MDLQAFELLLAIERAVAIDGPRDADAVVVFEQVNQPGVALVWSGFFLGGSGFGFEDRPRLAQQAGRFTAGVDENLIGVGGGKCLVDATHS